jgi:hypothetical protein
MERGGGESSGEPSQAAEGEQSRVAEKRRVVMAVTRILDSGTLDEKSLRLLEQLADCVQRPQAGLHEERSLSSRLPHSRLRPQEGSQ